MKDKDPNDEELNKEEQDNINEADDSFGLPDLDFNTLDEESEEEGEEESKEEDTTEETAEAVEEVEAIAEEEVSTEEETNVEEEDSYEEEVEEEAAPVRTTYVPPKPESNTPKIIAVLIIVILAVVAIWYFGFYRPQAAATEQARIEAEAKATEDARKLAAKKKTEADRLAAEQTANEAADEDEQVSSEATFITISESTGRYYIVIESFIDSDMAADYGKELVVKGFSTALLSPQGKRKFHRLTMSGDYGSFVEAQEEANKLKGEFGKDLWVLKY
jgi:hypothetical protein